MRDEDVKLLKNAVSFDRKPAKMGKTETGKDRYVFNIPQVYIDNKLVDPDEMYTVYLVKSEK